MFGSVVGGEGAIGAGGAVTGGFLFRLSEESVVVGLFEEGCEGHCFGISWWMGVGKMGEEVITPSTTGICAVNARVRNCQ